MDRSRSDFPSIVFCSSYRRLIEFLRQSAPRLGMRFYIGAPGEVPDVDAIYVSAMAGLDIGVELSYDAAHVVALQQPGPRMAVVGVAAPDGHEPMDSRLRKEARMILEAVAEFNASHNDPVRVLALDLDWLVGGEDLSLALAVVDETSNYLA